MSTQDTSFHVGHESTTEFSFEAVSISKLEATSSSGSVINSESIWKKEAITILGDYFLSKNEEVKANNYYKLLKIKKNN